MARTTTRIKEIIQQAKENLPQESVLSVKDRIDSLKDYFRISMKELGDIIGVDEKTLNNWKKEGFIGARESFQVDLVQELVKAGDGVLKQGKEEIWYKTPNPRLGNYAPINLIKDPQGLKDVKNLLEQRKWGLHS